MIFLSSKILISPEIPSLTHELFRSVLFNLHVFGEFSSYQSVMISSLIPLWSKSSHYVFLTQCMIRIANIYLHCLTVHQYVNWTCNFLFMRFLHLVLNQIIMLLLNHRPKFCFSFLHYLTLTGKYGILWTFIDDIIWSLG